MFSDNRKVTIKKLQESGLYDEILISNLSRKNLEYLKNLPAEKRADRAYMEPILFAIKNEFGTYRVFKYYAESIQDDLKLAQEIIVVEPQLIEGTPISSNKGFIMKNAQLYPQIIKYMSPELKQDQKLLQDLCDTKEPEVLTQVVQNCDVPEMIENNPELCNDKEFMDKAIKKDVNYLKNASEELKNDYEFLKQQSLKNEDVIGYVADNIQQFGIEGIKGVRDTSKEMTVEDCFNIIDELSQNSTDPRYQKVKKKIEEKGIVDVRTVRWLTAMVAQSKNVSPELMKKVLNYSILTMEKNKREVEQGDIIINSGNIFEFITPTILKKLRKRLEEQGIEVEEGLEEKLANYETFYKEQYAKFNEKRRQQREERAQNMQLKREITQEEVKKATQGVTISEIKEAIAEKREDALEERIQEEKEEEIAE